MDGTLEARDNRSYIYVHNQQRHARTARTVAVPPRRTTSAMASATTTQHTLCTEFNLAATIGVIRLPALHSPNERKVSTTLHGSCIVLWGRWGCLCEPALASWQCPLSACECACIRRGRLARRRRTRRELSCMRQKLGHPAGPLESANHNVVVAV